MEWHYLDNRGVPQTGTVEQTLDHGGSDVTYYFRNDTGKLDVLSGLRVKTTAHAVYGKDARMPGCPICDREDG